MSSINTKLCRLKLLKFLFDLTKELKKRLRGFSNVSKINKKLTIKIVNLEKCPGPDLNWHEVISPIGF